jgi:hypothetical protein
MVKRYALISAWVSQKAYVLLGILFVLLSVTLTAHAMLTVSNTGLSGDSNVTVDASGTLSIGTASSTGITIGKAGVPVSVPGTLSVTHSLSLGAASTTAGQVIFNNPSNAFTTLLQSSPSQTSNLSFTLPSSTGTAGQALLTDGNGALYFGSSGSPSQWVNGSNGSISYSGGTVSVGPASFSQSAGELLPVALPSSGPIAVAASGYYLNSASGALTFNLPVITSANIGAQFCFRNNTGNSGAITLRAPASTYIDLNGVNGSAAGTLVSGGALGDAACVVSVSATQYIAYPGNGSWTNN